MLLTLSAQFQEKFIDFLESTLAVFYTHQGVMNGATDV